jgi:hypothetical protein
MNDKPERNVEPTRDTQQDSAPPYSPPQFVDMGTVESITHGSRENDSDEPDAGYKGG